MHEARGRRPRGPLDRNMTARWYLVHCKPRQEAVAALNLTRQGYVVYYPRVRERRRRNARQFLVIAPMFPRYLFVNLDSETRSWSPIRSTLGVVSLVRFGETPALVPEDLVEMLRAREDADGIQPLSTQEYQRGTKVRITDGQFAGYEAVYFARTGRDRVVVLLDVLGRHTRMSVSLGAIEPTD